MELHFTQNVSTEDVKEELGRVLPQGLDILDAKRVPLNFPVIDILPNVGEYGIKGTGVDQTEKTIV
jgi:uncharacterized protein (DUF2344 family)